MLNQTRRVLENNIAPGIKIFGITGTSQYIVVTPGSEYSFTSEEAAQVFAQELAQKRDIHKTASVDHNAKGENAPLIPGAPVKKRRLFRLGM